MTIRLVDAGWGNEFTSAIRADASTLRIVSPFIKVGALERLLAFRPKKIEVITRFNLADFADGVSDIAAMRRLLAIGARVRGIKNLHAKLYLFGASRAIVSSANLTAAALDRNQEFGAVLQDPVSIAACDAYVDRLWRLGDTDLLPPQVDAWDETVTSYLAAGGRANRAGGLGDFGADVGSLGRPIAPLPAVFANTDQAFVKFLGAANIREPLSSGTVDELRRAGCHWALAYPPSKRPVGINDGALMFIARMIKEPNDTRGLEFDALAGRPHGGDGRGMDSRGGVGRGRTTHGHKRVGSARRVRRAKTGWKRGCPHSAE